jgi:hypothetical protein
MIQTRVELWQPSASSKMQRGMARMDAKGKDNRRIVYPRNNTHSIFDFDIANQVLPSC